MPVLIQNVSFYDNFGNGPLPAYSCNAGDRFSMRVVLWSSIRITSVSNPMILDAALDQITSSSISWLQEGFRAGDTAFCTVYTSGGAVVNSWSTTVNYVDDVMIDLDTVTTWPDASLGEFISIEVPAKVGRGDLGVLFNHVKNSSTGNEFSLIDGEATRVSFGNTQALGIGSTQVGVITGNQSGQYLISAELERLANPATNEHAYALTLVFVNSGIYDSTWFDSSECLKAFMKLKWSREPGEVSYLFEKVLNAAANTGWFDQAHNVDTIDATLVQGISELDYTVASTHTIKVDGPLTEIGIGGSYVPIDDTYFKNKILSQLNLGMVSPTTELTTTPQTSAVNGTGAGWEISIDDVTVAGSVTEIEITFTPNAQLTAFMAGREFGDRLFRIWVKCGNVNLLAFNDQMTTEPPVGEPLVIEGEKAFFDHSQNIEQAISSFDTTEFNTEDNFAYFGFFLLEKNKVYDLFSAKIEAFNAATEQDFTLVELQFGFAGVPISTDGRYLLNQTVNVASSLPTTSVKRDAKFYLFPAGDTETHYAVAIYFPALLRWEYWLPQANASTDFYPTQNKNWQQYDAGPDWDVRMELNLQEGGLSHTYTKDIFIKPYDSDEDIDQTIELYVDSTNQNVGIVTQGMLMRVVATHTLTNGNIWNQDVIWGEITVEPKESAPRWLISTIVPHDNNTNNPLQPLSGLLMEITYPAPNVARMECYFNPDIINSINGCKFTTKVKGCTMDAIVYKTMTDGTSKETTGGDLKTLST